MADQCIVCLDELDGPPLPDDTIKKADDSAAAAAAAASNSKSTSSSPRSAKGRGDGGAAAAPTGTSSARPLIALIKPCNHVLHDDCLREWSQKANSCPICRHTFNLVEVFDRVGGSLLSEYVVEDKKQVAEFDPSAFAQDDFEDEDGSRPCPVCGAADQEDVLLLCDGCDVPYHTYCIGLDRVPRGHWFCMECESEGAYLRAAEQEHTPERREPISGRSAPRTQASVRRTRQRMRTDHWYGAWSLFSSRVHDVAGLDLDFSEDEEQSMSSYRRQQRRTADERREFRAWQQRLNIATRQGARDIFRQAAPPRLRERTPQPVAESPEETKSWGAFERAKAVDTSSPRSRKRKLRSVTASPQEAPEPERRNKRPRTRRVLDKPSSSSASPFLATTATAAGPSREMNGHGPPSPSASGTSDEPSFLKALLKEVETATSDDDTPRSVFSTRITGPNRATSPLQYSSPVGSPSPPSSSYHTPRAMSITPPPHITKRPGSPLPLTSRIEPIFPPADYSPNRSPPESNHKPHDPSSPTLELREPRPRRQQPVKLPRSEDTSPMRASMTIEAKEGINKIVKSALAPHWKSAEITKEQYADINRDVSRKMYEIIAGSNISDERERGGWEKIATAEVATALKSLST